MIPLTFGSNIPRCDCPTSCNGSYVNNEARAAVAHYTSTQIICRVRRGLDPHKLFRLISHSGTDDERLPSVTNRIGTDRRRYIVIGCPKTFEHVATPDTSHRAVGPIRVETVIFLVSVSLKQVSGAADVDHSISSWSRKQIATDDTI